MALRKIKAGEVGDATELLESRVDDAIISYWAYSKFDFSTFTPGGLTPKVDFVNTYRSGVGLYRSEVSSTSFSPDVQETIEATVADLMSN